MLEIRKKPDSVQAGKGVVEEVEALPHERCRKCTKSTGGRDIRIIEAGIVDSKGKGRVQRCRKCTKSTGGRDIRIIEAGIVDSKGKGKGAESARKALNERQRAWAP